MASMALPISTSPCPYNRSLPSPQPQALSPRSLCSHAPIKGNTFGLKTFIIRDSQQGLSRRFLFPPEEDLRILLWPKFAVGSGLEASIADSKGNDIKLRNVTVVVESQDAEKIHVRVDLTGEETQMVFDDVLTNLARTAPPIPGFRRQKGGKTSNVPKSFLLQILGRDRVTKFVIQEIVSSTMAGYVEKENLKVNNTFKTTQTAEELESAFTPGSEFGFNATMEIEESEAEATVSSSSEA